MPSTKITDLTGVEHSLVEILAEKENTKKEKNLRCLTADPSVTAYLILFL